MIRVIFDTNFLMYAVDFRGDIFQAIENSIGQKIEKILLIQIYDEIQCLALNGTNKVMRQAKRVLKFLKEKQAEFQIISIPSSLINDVDQMIASYAQKNLCYVATNDKELKKILRNLGIPMIFIRQRTQIGVHR